MSKAVSLKRIQINKANTMMVVAIALAAFIVVFSLVASRALWNKRGFQGRLIAEKEVAVDQLNKNIDTVDDLVIAYKAFVETPDNVIGGNPKGTGERGGDNAKITLDALPSKYDFPALATSLEKIIRTDNNQIDSITGIDDEIAQSAVQEGAPQIVEIPFEMAATSSVDSVKALLLVLERSIRPIKLNTLQVSGSNSDLQLSVTAKTYYQPEKTLNVQKKVVQ
jgi:hypothetical protein